MADVSVLVICSAVKSDIYVRYTLWPSNCTVVAASVFREKMIKTEIKLDKELHINVQTSH